MKRILSLGLTAALIGTASLAADWKTAQAEALKVGAGNTAFQTEVKQLISAKTPEVFMAFATNKEYKKADVAEVLIKFLEHDQPPMRMTSIAWLMKIGDKSTVPHMVEAMKNEDATVQRMAANFVSRHAGDRIGELVKPLLSDKVTSVRMAAVMCLSSAQNETLAVPIASMLKDEDKSVRTVASHGLQAQLNLPLWLSPRSPEGGEGPKAGSVVPDGKKNAKLVAAKLPKVTIALDQLFKDKTLESAMAVVSACEEKLDLAQNILLATLVDHDEKIRVTVLSALERLAQPAGAEAVTQVFVEDKRQAVRVAAAKVLNRMITVAQR